MKKLLTILALLLLIAILASCGQRENLTPSPLEPTPIPPTDTPMPEIGEIVVGIGAELTQETCAGYDPIVGGHATVGVTTEDGELGGIGKVELYVDEALANTGTEPPFEFAANLNEYEDGTELTLRAKVYDMSGAMRQSESLALRVDNTPEPTLRSLGEQVNLEMANIIDLDAAAGTRFHSAMCPTATRNVRITTALSLVCR